MSTNYAEIKGHKCADCAEEFADIDIDRMDSQGCHGLSIKDYSSDGLDRIDLSPQMIADLVDVLVEYQND